MVLRASLPSGTVTLLFTDIEGSTQHWEEQRVAMPAMLRRHDELVRSIIESHGGYIFKTIGDAFCAAFGRAPDALAAAADAQRALTTEDWSAVGGLAVRMALHSGTTDEREGDYFGPAVNRAARLLAVAHGGQVVVSGTTEPLLRGVMPEQTELRDLGDHRLKDLAEPEHVWQLAATGLVETFPPLRSLESMPNNLPRQLTPLVGREDVLAEVEWLVVEHPLVSLVGTGGVGKTRVALQAAADLLDGSGDGVWFIDLAPLRDQALVITTTAATLGLREQGERPMLAPLLQYLRQRRLLLILDNCEHLIEAVAHVADAILRAAPQVRLLATSREPLRIEGEHVYRMPSLAVPPAGDSLTADQALEYGAISLFVQRATASDTTFKLTGESAPIVAEICRRLDGIALAIELAAARVKVLAPRELAQKLDKRFRVLTGGSRTALPRQQTMRALIDWSYELLSDDERAIFRRLSIFAGGFTLGSVSAVCSGDAIDEIAVLDLLSSLVDKSLVQAEVVGSGARYRLLESTRQYARERLSEAREYEAVAHAHATAFLALAEQLDQMYETTPDRTWYARAEPELENWRTVLEWALTLRADVTLGQRLIGAMRWIWAFYSPSEGRRWVRLALETTDADSADGVLAKLDLAESQLDISLTEYKASSVAAERALERFAQIDDERGRAEAGWSAGRSLLFLGYRSEGEAVLNRALASAQRLGLHKLTCWILPALAEARARAGDLDGARVFYNDALAMARAMSFERMTSVLTGMLAEDEFRRGDAPAAIRLASEALEAARAVDDRRGIIIDLCNMAAYLVTLKRFVEVREVARKALVAARDAQQAVSVAFVLQHLAAAGALQPSSEAQSRDQRATATRLLGYVDARLTALKGLREYTEQQEANEMISVLRDSLGADEFLRLMAEGSTWNEDQAIAEALSI